jgi:uncharacterized protein (TIGR02118 family)
MVKGLFFARRKPGMSVQAFHEYWRSKHADLTRNSPHIRRYVQSHTLLSSYGNPNMPYAESEPRYDGMATMWFNSVEERRWGNKLPQAQIAIADQANFTELSDRRFLLTTEVVQKEGAVTPSSVHLIALLTRKPGMSVEAFQRYWREHHGPLASKASGLRRYVQDHPLPESYGARNAPLCDGVAEAWFDSLEDLQRSTETPEVKAVRADEPNLMDLDKLVFILTTDLVIF